MVGFGPSSSTLPDLQVVSGEDLAESYCRMACSRLAGLEFFFARGDWAIVVREAQECVELALKAALRRAGVEPMKVHDVGRQLEESRNRLPLPLQNHLPRIREISFRLRKERETAFYGDVDLVPTEIYKREDAREALENARLVVGLVCSPVPRNKKA